MLRALCHKTMLIDGQLVTRPDPLVVLARSAGVELLSQPGQAGTRRARLIRSGRSIYLVDVKIIIRASGRLRRHLSRYLVARDLDGVIYEIFLGLVRGAANTAVGLWSRLRQAAARLATIGLTPWQIRELLL